MYMMSYLSIAVELFYDTTIDVYNIVLKSIASVAVDKPRASCLGMVGRRLPPTKCHFHTHPHIRTNRERDGYENMALLSLFQ
jgi:hypothetical protein